MALPDCLGSGSLVVLSISRCTLVFIFSSDGMRAQPGNALRNRSSEYYQNLRAMLDCVIKINVTCKQLFEMHAAIGDVARDGAVETIKH